MDINKLLNPKKIAIIGASEKEGFGGDSCRNAISYMAEGTYFFVNPRRDTILGKPCYPSVTDLPENIDLVVICTPLSTVEDLLRESSRKGAGAAVLYASGYSEVGTVEGRRNEASLKAVAESLGMAVMGPNCAGFINPLSDVAAFAFISGQWDRKGSVGFVSQSGQLVLSMMDSPRMKFSYAISSGNSSIVSMEDYLDFLVDDEATKVVALYLEGVKNPVRLISALKKAALKRKPVVILKTGRSQKGQAIAASHTGSLSGTDKVFDALFRKFGVIRVDDLEELMSASMALSTLKKMPLTAGFASMNLSGGETGICADLGEKHGITYSDFQKKTLDRLKELLPSYASPNNPLDMTATLSYDADKYAEALQTVMDDEGVGLVAIGYTLLQDITDPAIHYMAKGIEKVCARPGSKPVVMIPFTENTRNEEYSLKLADLGVPILPTSNYAFRILKHISDFTNYDPEMHNLNVVLPHSVKEGGTALSEFESIAIVREYGIPFTHRAVAQKKDDIRYIVEDCQFPIVAKIDSPDILHKSDMGCVKLNLNNHDEVHAAFEEILANAGKSQPDARINGVQICSMAKSGIEIIIGIKNDPQLGPCILCGLGGIFVEVFKDIALRLAPVSKDEAREMIHSLKGIQLLKGCRGRSPADIDALVDAIVSVSNLATDHRNSVKELDINPIFLYENGLCAVDALYVQNK